MKLLFATLVCLFISVFGAPEPQRYYRTSRRISTQPVRSSRLQVKTTRYGTLNLDPKNVLTFKQRYTYYPIMKALLKVMETSTPSPSDVNNLLVLSRDLAKETPDGNQTFPAFGGLEVGVNDLGLLPEGDAIVEVDGTPNIVTAYGAFPLSDISLMTDEERELYLPAIKAFIKVLESDNLTQEEVDELVTEGEKLQELLPEHWKEIINQTINDNFGKEIYEAQQEQKALEAARIRAQQQALIRSRTPRKKSSPIGKFLKGVKRHFSKKFG